MRGHITLSRRCFLTNRVFVTRTVHELWGWRPSQDTAFFEFAELSGDPVEIDIDLPFVIPAEPNPKHDIVDFLRRHRCAHRLTGESRLHPVQESVDLVDLVSPAQRASSEPITMIGHYRATFRDSPR